MFSALLLDINNQSPPYSSHSLKHYATPLHNAFSVPLVLPVVKKVFVSFV